MPADELGVHTRPTGIWMVVGFKANEPMGVKYLYTRNTKPAFSAARGAINELRRRGATHWTYGPIGYCDMPHEDTTVNA